MDTVSDTRITTMARLGVRRTRRQAEPASWAGRVADLVAATEAGEDWLPPTRVGPDQLTR